MHATVSLMGRLGSDPELRYLPDGTAVANFNLAIQPYGQEAPDWWRVTVWEKTAEFCANNLGKGCRVYVEGRPGLDEWEGQDGGHNAKLAVTARVVQAIDWANAPEAGEKHRPASGEAPPPSRREPSTEEPPPAPQPGRYRKTYQGSASRGGR